ncbi:DUF2249 domain-containing protein [Castellaniella defragrans]|jgi:uncharacterized protein (DUF2249 family)|uniref:DUF2249 domain-containing protein n=2 Tax=Castellaniella defragrans TaxID=75697 RepID=W8WWR9_CASD6|nr:DUF2249 domain-containing protein [Castellaniella defragrans]KAB0610002.1 DUF2249 domain-containing protein [Castellaniella defragrans]MBB6085499.1 uncharacterized protein (DUF2249 family) [Castellaniella defragrans]CDM24024.1 hypothetical protein BN940_07806 [Castellaniella defragrans 65Phen]
MAPPPDLTLDVRSMPPPEPLEHCLEALADLAPGQRLHMLIDREPYPLYTILDRDGFQHCCTFEDTHFQVTIWYDAK